MLIRFLLFWIHKHAYVCTCTSAVEWLIGFQDVPGPLPTRPWGNELFCGTDLAQVTPITGWFNIEVQHSPPEPKGNANIYSGEKQRHQSSEESHQFCALMEPKADFDHPLGGALRAQSGDEAEPVDQSPSHSAGLEGKQATTSALAELPSVETHGVGTQNSNKRKRGATSDSERGGGRKRKRARKCPRDLETREKIPVGIRKFAPPRGHRS